MSDKISVSSGQDSRKSPAAGTGQMKKPLLAMKNQRQLEILAPQLLAESPRFIHLPHKGNQALGFSVRGGLEHGVGLYVSHVRADSQAQRQGLKIGDEIIQVNGFTLGQATHHEAYNLISMKQDLVLRVRNIGMIPVKNAPDDKLQWKYVKHLDENKAHLLGQEVSFETQDALKEQEIRLVINLAVGASLGCSVVCGPPERPGIFVQTVKKDSVAMEAGLEPGDQVLEVNGTIFSTSSLHSEALVALKASRNVKIRIRKGMAADIYGVPKLNILSKDEDSRTFQIHKNERPDNKLGCAENKTSTAVKVANNWQAKPNEKLAQRRPSREDLWQQRENEALKRERLQSNLQRGTGGNKVSAKTAEAPRQDTFYDVYEEVGGREQLGSEVSAMYMSTYTEHKPTFKMQRPVLLSPTGRAAAEAERKRSIASIVPEELEEDETCEGNFNPYRVFTNEEIAGRQIRLINIMKTGGHLGMTLKAGVSEGEKKDEAVTIHDISPSGLVHQQGGIQIGDQLMLVEWTSLMGVTLEQAEDIVHKAFQASKPVMQLVVAKTPQPRGDDEMFRRSPTTDNRK